MDEFAGSHSTRDRIKSVAAELFIVRGHDGFSFGDVAEAVDVTRANIHHHFGNKQNLMKELVRDIADDAATRIAHHWTNGHLGFAERFQLQLDDLRTFHRRFNPKPGDREIWSPVSRIRHDLASLGEEAETALTRINQTYEQCLDRAIRDAVENGDLRAETPVPEIARLLRVSFLAAPPMTQDSGTFDEIEKLFDALDRTLIQPWSPHA